MANRPAKNTADNTSQEAAVTETADTTSTNVDANPNFDTSEKLGDTDTVMSAEESAATAPHNAVIEGQTQDGQPVTTGPLAGIASIPGGATEVPEMTTVPEDVANTFGQRAAKLITGIVGAEGATAFFRSLSEPTEPESVEREKQDKALKAVKAQLAKLADLTDTPAAEEARRKRAERTARANATRARNTAGQG